jgi:cation:H+ antiporter
MVWYELIGLLIAFLILAKSGSYVVKSLTQIARFFRMSEFVLASLLMGFGTSFPELVVGISAAFAKAPALVLGNVIGSNIANLTIIIGIPIILAKGIKLESKIMREDSFYMILISILVLFLMLDKTLSRFDGAILLGVFLLYIVKTLKHHKKFEKTVNNITYSEFFNNLVLFFISLILVIVSAKFVVDYAIKISEILNLPQILIGLFVVAIGTSLPELVFGIKTVMSKHEGMALGNIFGSVIFNSTLILGVSALIYPITSDFLLFLVSSVFLIVLTFTFWTFLESDKKLSWQEGIALILFYVFFIIVELTIKGVI